MWLVKGGTFNSALGGRVLIGNGEQELYREKTEQRNGAKKQSEAF